MRTDIDSLAAPTYRKVLGRLLPYLCICYVVAFIDRSNVGFTKLEFTRTLGFSEAVYGFGAGIFYLGYILLEIPSNLVLARIGLRKTLLRIMLLWGLACMALAFMQSAAHYYTLRFVLGAAEAGLFPGILLYLTYWVPASRRARFTALFMASIPVAGILGGPLAGWIMSALDTAAGLHGWQWVFLLEGAPAVLLGLAAYFVLDDRPADARWLTAAQKALIARDLAAEGVKETTRTPLRTVLSNPSLYALGALGFAIMVSTGGLFLWLPTILRASGVQDVLQIGLLSAIPFTLGCIVQFLVARHSDRSQERLWHAVGPSLIAATGWLLLPLAASNTALALATLTLAAVGTLAAMGPFWSLPATLLAKPAQAAGIAFVTTLAGAGNFVSPIFVGWLADRTGSLASGQYYFGALFVVGATLVTIGSARRPLPSSAMTS